MLRVGDGGDGVVRLVQCDVDLALRRVDQFAIDLDVIAVEIGFRAELSDGRAVDGDAPLGHQLLGLTPRGDPGLRDDFLEALLGHYDSGVSAGDAASGSVDASASGSGAESGSGSVCAASACTAAAVSSVAAASGAVSAAGAASSLNA